VVEEELCRVEVEVEDVRLEVEDVRLEVMAFTSKLLVGRRAEEGKDWINLELETSIRFVEACWSS